MQSRDQRRWRLPLLAVTLSCFLANSLAAQSPIGPKILVNPPSAGAQDSPDLEFDDRGNLWITWLDTRGPDASSDRVMARAVTPRGELDPPLTLVDTSDVPLTPAMEPLILPTPEGFQLIYTRQTEDGFAHVYDQRFDAAGQPLGRRSTLTPPPPASAIGFAAAALPTEGFVLMTLGFPCVTCPKPPPGGIFAGIYASDVASARQYFRVSRKSETVVQGVRGLTVSGQGEVILVWGGVDDLETRDGSDIHAKRFSARGEPLGVEFLVNTTSRGTQSGPSVAGRRLRRGLADTVPQ
jgi:hypothetical protein